MSGSRTEPTPAAASGHRTPRSMPRSIARVVGQTRRLLLVYGICLAAVGGVWLHAADIARDLNPTREYDLQQGLAVLKAGGPLLLGRGQPIYAGLEPRFAQHSGYYPLGIGDTQGVYVVVPVVGRLLAADDAVDVYRWLYIVLFAAPLIVYPLLFYGLFDAVLPALLVPVLFLGLARGLAPSDLGGLSAWPIYVLLPLLLLLSRHSWRWTTPALLVIVLIAGFASQIRAGAGLPILLAGIVLTLLRLPGARQKVVTCAAVAVLYVAPGWGLSALQHRAHGHIANPVLRSQALDHHTVWHMVLIGLAFPGNRYGVTRFGDEVGFKLVRAKDPSVVLISPHNEALAKEIVFDDIRAYPGFVLVGYLKRAVIVASELDWLWLGFFVLPFMVLMGRHRRRMHCYLALVLPVVALTALVPAIAIYQSYIDSLKAASAIVLFLAIGWLATNGSPVLELSRGGRAGLRRPIAAFSLACRSSSRETRVAFLLTLGVVGLAAIATKVGIAFQAQYLP